MKARRSSCRPLGVARRSPRSPLGSARHLGVVVVGLGLSLIINACGPAAPAPPSEREPAAESASPSEQPGESVAEGLSTYELGPLWIHYPHNATIEELGPDHVRLVGPSFTFRRPEGGTDEGWGYEMTFQLHSNAEGASAEEWARDRILTGWREAMEAKMAPGGLPVTAEGEIDERKVEPVRLIDRPAVRFEYFRGDSYGWHYFLAHGDQVVEISHPVNIEANVPWVRMQDDVHALILAALELGAGGEDMDVAEDSARGPASGSADERVGANASGRYFGYIRAVTDVDGSGPDGWRVDFDIARFLAGDEAGAAAVEDGVVEAPDELPNDFYIRNLDSRTERFSLPADAVVELLGPTGGPELERVPVERIVRLFLSDESNDPAWMREMPYWIEVEEGLLRRVEMQYLP